MTELVAQASLGAQIQPPGSYGRGGPAGPPPYQQPGFGRGGGGGRGYGRQGPAPLYGAPPGLQAGGRAYNPPPQYGYPGQPVQQPAYASQRSQVRVCK